MQRDQNESTLRLPLQRIDLDAQRIQVRRRRIDGDGFPETSFAEAAKDKLLTLRAPCAKLHGDLPRAMPFEHGLNHQPSHSNQELRLARPWGRTARAAC